MYRYKYSTNLSDHLPLKKRKQTFFKSETHLKLNIVLLVLWLCCYVIQKYNFN